MEWWTKNDRAQGRKVNLEEALASSHETKAGLNSLPMDDKITS